MSRPILPWHYPTETLPADGKDVWLRRLPFYDKPVLGQWSVGDLCWFITTWEADGTTSERMQVAYEAIHTWKYRYLADEQAHVPPPSSS